MFTSAEEIHSKLGDIRGISTLPHVMTRIMAVAADEDSSAKDLAREVRSDQALASKILKVVNSAYYGFYRKIANIDDAVVILGFKEIRSMCLALTVMHLFSEGQNEYFDRRQLWRHSVITALLAEMLAEPYAEEHPQAFTAGLLHDLGRAVLDQFFPEAWKEVCLEVERRQCHWLQVEQDLLGTDHAEVGFWLAERWDFPTSLTESIRFHHEPSRAEVAPRLTGIVHLANLLSRRDLPAPPPPERIPPLDQRVYEHVPLSKDRVDQLVDKFAKNREGVQALLDSILPA